MKLHALVDALATARIAVEGGAVWIYRDIIDQVTHDFVSAEVLRVDLTSGSITTAIDRLEQRGLVARAAHASDRRARVVHLTPTGKTRITHVFATHKEAMDRAAHGLSKAERGTLIELLKKLGTTAEHQLTEGERKHDDHPDG